MISAVNYHLTRACDAKCRFCFATFRGIRSQLSLAEARRLIEALKRAGAEKINFAGGEPTLHPHLGELIAHAKGLGMVTSVVSNGARLARLLDDHGDALDWVGLSVDAASEDTQRLLGRGRGDHIARAIALSERCRQLGLRVKLNTVVSALTWRQDMSEVVRAMRPERWKVFQVLPVGGQNDGVVDDLLISRGQLTAFVERHAHLAAEGFEPIVEDNDAMRGSYVMVDPRGRFFGNSTAQQVYSEPVLEVGVERALAQVDFRPDKFEARGGRYEWARRVPRRQPAEAPVSQRRGSS